MSQQTSEPTEGELPEHLREQGYELGDVSDATINTSDTRRKWLTDDVSGTAHWVELRDVAWSQKNQILTDSLKRVDGSGKLDFASYYREIAKVMIEDNSWDATGEELTRVLAGLNTRLGGQLENHLPDPVSELEEAEEEN